MQRVKWSRRPWRRRHLASSRAAKRRENLEGEDPIVGVGRKQSLGFTGEKWGGEGEVGELSPEETEGASRIPLNGGRGIRLPAP